MTRLGFLLDSESCIGCHACTVACKSEHDVPLGVNRTWVKYVETGTYPDTQRHFSVMRCNQCDDAPCISICPTGALFRAGNGVVDFDDRNCIGCKSCMNACPYDAIYLHPESHTAHKCNFCNHRIAQGLLPSCVIVCPTGAIVVGDLDDPTSPLSQMAAAGQLAVRAPEQGTRPKVYYRGADDASLDPLRTAIAADGMSWSDTTTRHPTLPVPAPDAPGRTTYTTQHGAVWGPLVSAYLVTKAVAAGVVLVAALLVALGHADDQAAVGVAAPVVAGTFAAVTGLLLVADLKRPERFLFILTRSNPSSWLVRGAWVLGLFAIGTAGWWVAGLAGADDAIRLLAAPVALLAAATAGYTAFLFAQCEGRDLWQTPLLLPLLLAQAAIAGAAAFAVLDLAMDVPEPGALRWVLLLAVVGAAGLIAVELASPRTRQAAVATEAMTRGPWAARFWWGGVGAGLVVPGLVAAVALALDVDTPWPMALAGAIAVGGMFAHEDALVGAGQSAPLS